MRTPAIIVDLDGTLYDCRKRRDEFLKPEKKDFDGFHKAAVNDQPNVWCGIIAKSMSYFRYKLIFVSGRDHAHETETIWWLQHFYAWRRQDYHLFMRPDGDQTPDDEMKKKIYLTNIEPFFEILFCIDDRKKVVDMWRSLGLVCLQCDVGDF